MPIELYPNIAKVKRNGVYQNLPGFVQASGDADIKAMIASSETSTTAQYQHLKNSFFILNDVLYQADANINVNDIIAIGTNCHVAILSDYVSYLINLIPDLENKVDKDGIAQVSEENCQFFENVYKNYFDPDNVVVVNDHLVNGNARYATETNVTTLLIPVDRNTQYLFYAPNINRGYVIGKSDNNSFVTGAAYAPLLSSTNTNDKIIFTTGETTDYVAIYIYNAIYDYQNNKSKIRLYKNLTDLPVGEPQIKLSVLPKEVQYGISCLKDANVLIFGDSITDSCNITINSSDETTALSWTTNQYTNAQGNVVQYYMWARMMNESGIFGEIRNYARQGASFKDAVRTAGEERQNVSYQITVALNDLDNPNNVFSVDNFVPDIVIFALGTNDGSPNDTYEDAMAKTVYEEDGVTIDVDATLANLDLSKFCEAMRSAFLRTRVAFPYSQFYCVLPIQRANREDVNGALIEKMAKRYGCIIIDGCSESGIIRDTNVWEGLGTTLKDGLHPNDKGQNMMLRMILKQLSSHYCKTDFMNQ